jgi:energy-coupling factor transporter ATP-binding protein EcfA2
LAKITRLKIEKFRNIAPGTELVFADGINVLLGKNGTGKTTLLRLLEAITSVNFSAFESEEFDLELTQVSSSGEIRFKIRNERVSEPVSISLPNLRPFTMNSQFASSMRAEISVGSDESRVQAIVETANGKTTTQIGNKSLLHEVPSYPTMGSPGWFMPLLLRHPRFASTLGSGAPRFDEALGFYESIKKRNVYLHWYPGDGNPLGRLSLGATGVTLNGEDAKTPAQTLSIDAAKSPLAEKVKNALGVKNTSIQLSLSSVDISGISIYTDLRFWLTRRDGTQFSDDHLSFGQKRLVSFLFYINDAVDYVIADELVNGLHHDWIDLCVNSIEERQAFLTSQNPLLMDYLSFNESESIRRSFIICSVDYEGDTEIIRWRNMTAEQAQSVFEAGEAGISYLSTILRNEGLW